MTPTQIPFVAHTGIIQEGEHLALIVRPEVLNHVGTLHASAQFTLAETASGAYLAQIFPDLADKVVPLLRDSSMKFRKPATEKVVAFASINDETLATFKAQFEKKGRATVAINVELKEGENTTAQATFEWYIQRI